MLFRANETLFELYSKILFRNNKILCEVDNKMLSLNNEILFELYKSPFRKEKILLVCVFKYNEILLVFQYNTL